MNYTHDEIISALKTIQEICAESKCIACPFGQGQICVLKAQTAENWKINNNGKTFWRAFLNED